MSNETRVLSKYIYDINFNDIPTEIIEEVKLFLLDYLGVTLKGSTTETGEITRDFQIEFGSAKKESTIIGSNHKVTSQAAAFANAVASHSIELDDVDDLALFHYGPPVLSATLAVSEAHSISGRSFLNALILGCDIMRRISNAMNPELRDRGFHTTPVCGVFGSAAATAKIENLSVDEIASALGIAGAHASGLMEMYGPSMQKRINPGPAAHNGIVSARLAKRGYTGAGTILEGERGVLKAFADNSDARSLVKDLGKFELGIEYKRYACARPIHNAVDCALELRSNLVDQLDQIEEMIIWRHPSWAHYHQIPNPKSIHEAQMSLNHAVAVALVEGDAFLDEFSYEWINNKQVNKLSNLLQFKVDDNLKRGVSCRLQIKLKSGKLLESTIDYPKGSIKNPMTKEDHWIKFQKLAKGKLTEKDMRKVKQMVEGLELIKDINHLMAVFN